MFIKSITIKKAFGKMLHKSKKNVSPKTSFPYIISNSLHLERYAFCYQHYCEGYYPDPRQGGGKYHYFSYQRDAHIPRITTTSKFSGLYQMHSTTPLSSISNNPSCSASIPRSMYVFFFLHVAFLTASVASSTPPVSAPYGFCRY